MIISDNRLKYAGIGSRQTPDNILQIFVELGEFLGNNNVILRSGGASGADSAFESGCDLAKGPKEIYLPWQGFNDNPSPLYGVTLEAKWTAKAYHPRWDKLTEKGKALIARNGYQVLGESLENPVDFIICYTENGALKGGTAQALRIAEKWNIPVYNFGKKSFDNGLYDAILAKIQCFKLFN